jgi:hypothetical protein
LTTDGRSAERSDNPLGFALDFLGGKAHVTLGRRHLGGLVRLEHLALEVPRVSFPFDVSGGAGRFRHRRCRLRRCEAWVEAEAFASWFTARESLATYGFHQVRLRWLERRKRDHADFWLVRHEVRTFLQVHVHQLVVYRRL